MNKNIISLNLSDTKSCIWPLEISQYVNITTQELYICAKLFYLQNKMAQSDSRAAIHMHSSDGCSASLDLPHRR